MGHFSASMFDVAGVNVTLFNITPPGQAPAAAESRSRLTIPWHDLQENPNPFSLLTWHTHRQNFAGREAELEELRRWAHSKQKVSARFVTAPGGAGKSRLAAEFADELDTEGWSAGFVDLRNAAAYEGNGKGTLFIVDYPEQNHHAVQTLLEDIAKAGLSQRLRILFLTRCAIQEWGGIIADAAADSVVDWNPIVLAPLTPDEGHSIFCQALEFASEAAGTTPPPLSVAAVEEWMRMAQRNELPLFLVALAVFSAQNPDDSVARYSGPEIIAALNQRETRRLQQQARDAGLAQDSLVLAVAYATLCGGLPVEELDADQEGLKDLLGLGEGAAWRQALAASGHMTQGVLRKLEPDIVGTDFAHAALQRNGSVAPMLVWLAAKRAPEAAVATFGRLIYDAQTTLRRDGALLKDWLEQALEQDPARCDALVTWQQHAQLPLSLASCAVLICHQLSHADLDDAVRGGLLNNLSGHLSALGRHPEALEAGQKAVDIFRELSEQDPAAFEPGLTMSLNTLSNHLSALGRSSEALEAVREAMDICRRLTEQDPAAFEPNLALSLINLSSHLSTQGRRFEALEASQEAVDIYRRLAEQDPAAFEPNLALSLITLSKALTDQNRRFEALEAGQETVSIYRRLVEQNPAAFEPNLALSLITLSNAFNALARRPEALETIQEAVDIYRRLAAQNSAVFKTHLALSLNNLSVAHAELGRGSEALEAGQEAVGIFRGLTAQNPAVFEPDLAMSLNTLSNALTNLGRHPEALTFILETVSIYRGLAAQNPTKFEPDLAGSLNNFSCRLADLGRHPEALAFILETVNIYRGLAEQNPATFKPNLAMSLNNFSQNLTALGRHSEALEAIREGVDIYRRLAEQNPAAFKPNLAMSLNNLSNGLSTLGQRPEALESIQETVRIFCGLAPQNPAVFEPILAKSLRNMARLFLLAGEPEKALPCCEESVRLFRAHAGKNFAVQRSQLLASLILQRDILMALGREDEAQQAEAEAEAEKVRRRLG